MPYTALQKIRRLYAQHHSNNSKMVSVFADDLDIFKTRKRGEYSPAERKMLANTVTIITNTLEIDDNVKAARVLLKKQHKLLSKLKKLQKS